MYLKAFAHYLIFRFVIQYERKYLFPFLNTFFVKTFEAGSCYAGNDSLDARLLTAKTTLKANNMYLIKLMPHERILNSIRRTIECFKSLNWLPV